MKPAPGVAALLAAVLLATGCSGVPSHSRADVIRSVAQGADAPSSGPGVAPEPGADPRSIVSGFLQASVSSDAAHSSARQFLTADARRKWQDSTVIVVDDYRVQVPQTTGGSGSVSVTGHRVGQIDARGVFGPMLKGIGVGDPETFTFGLRKIEGEWRIDQLQQGVLINRLDFETYFRPRPLYFFDSSESLLVPDLRYSPAEGQPLAQWLLTQMLAGPRAELLASVVNEVPDQIDPRRTNVVSDVRIQVEMPGTAQIDGVGKQRLAEQLAFTFELIQSSPSTLRLTDGGKPVSIPGVGDDFSTSDFPAVGPSSVLTSVPFFYLRNGVLIGSDGKPIPGRINEGHYGLTGVSLRPGVKGEARVVAVSATALLMGSLAAGLVRVPVPAATLSRPEWRPNSDDAWVGTERGLFRIGADSRPVSIVATSSRGSLPAGRVTALRFSTDGSRLALVLQAADRTSALWIGSVVTSGAEVRIDSLEPITPSALSVFDIAWSSATSLVLIGADTLNGSGERGVWSVYSDGSVLRSESTGGLPTGLQTITAAPQQFTLVAAGGAIWIQRNSTWSSLDAAGPTVGESPAYAQ